MLIMDCKRVRNMGFILVHGNIEAALRVSQ
jgi:hypothetical protein